MYSIKPVPIANVPLVLPLAQSKVQAGFPSPADDFHIKRIDLNDVLVKHPHATFLLKVSGDSMREAGIDDGDTLVVDKSVLPKHGHIVVALVNSEFTVKRLYCRGRSIRLQPANPTYPEIRFKDLEELSVWGVVTSCIKRFQV